MQLTASSGTHNCPFWLAATAATVGGLGLRILIALSPLGSFNSDEAITGLTVNSVIKMEFPLVVPGNDYGGVLEAYVFAPFVYLFRQLTPSAWNARLLDILNIGLHSMLFALLFGAIRRTTSRITALVAILPIWLFSATFIRLASETYLGYIAATAAAIGSVWLGCAYERQRSGPTNPVNFAQATQKRMKYAYVASSGSLPAAATFLAGVAFWQHPLAALLPVCTLAYLCISDLFRSVPNQITRWLLAGITGILGASPALFRLAQRHNDLRLATTADNKPFRTRLIYVFTEHLPRGFGLRTGSGPWIQSSLKHWVPVTLLVMVVGSSVILFLRGLRCLATLPLGLVGFAQAIPTSYTTDGRYSMFIAPLLTLMMATAIHSIRPARSVRPAVAVDPGQSTSGQPFDDAIKHRFANASIRLRRGKFIAPGVLGLTMVAGGILAMRPMSESIHDLRWQSDPQALRFVRFLDEKNLTNVRGPYWLTYRIAHITSERINATDYSLKRIGRMEKRVAASPPTALAWIADADAPQPAEVVNNPDWPNEVIDSYRVYWYRAPGTLPIRTTTPDHPATTTK
jgi:hypothetical protein